MAGIRNNHIFTPAMGDASLQNLTKKRVYASEVMQMKTTMEPPNNQQQQLQYPANPSSVVAREGDRVLRDSS